MLPAAGRKALHCFSLLSIRGRYPLIVTKVRQNLLCRRKTCRFLSLLRGCARSNMALGQPDRCHTSLGAILRTRVGVGSRGSGVPIHVPQSSNYLWRPPTAPQDSGAWVLLVKV